MSATFKIKVNRLVNSVPREFRTAVITAADLSDGSIDSFRDELNAQAWDMPELPVREIVEELACQA